MLAFLRIDVNKAMNVNKQIYLDYQATTPVAREVVDAMLPYFTENFGNPHSTQHEVGRASSAAVEQARKKVATMIEREEASHDKKIEKIDERIKKWKEKDPQYSFVFKSLPE